MLRLNLVLFAVAVVVGLGLSAAGAKSLVRALRRLVDGAKAIEAGDFGTPVPVTSKDEIGQLAQAFNHMAEELRTKERVKDTFGKYLDPRGRHIIVWRYRKTCGSVQGCRGPASSGIETRTSRTRNDMACRSARRSSPSPTRGA